MTRDFYFYGNLFIGLAVLCSAMFGFSYFLVGSTVLGLQSVTGWLIVWTLVTLGASLFVLQYYRHKGYSFAFWAALASVATNVLVSVHLYLIMHFRLLQPYYMTTVVAGVIVGLVYSASLIARPAGKNIFLRTAGILLFIMGAAYLSVLMWSIKGYPESVSTVTKVDQWLWLFRMVVPVLFIMQFRRESKLVTADTEPIIAKKMEDFLGITAMLAIVATLFLAGRIATDGLASRRWSKVNAARAERLVKMSETRTFKNGEGDTLRYILTRPHDFDPAKKYPLVVCLPYTGYQAPPADWLAGDEVRSKYQAFLLVPYCAAGTSWGGLPPEAFKDVELDDLVYETLLSLDDPGIDKDRIYISGVSRGGYGSWHLITEHPEVFAAAIPVCGAGDPAMAPRIIDVAVWAFHGAKDLGVPVSGSRDMISAIEKAGGHPKYTEFGHLGHNIWHDVSKTPGLLEWLFAQKRASVAPTP